MDLEVCNIGFGSFASFHCFYSFLTILRKDFFTCQFVVKMKRHRWDTNNSKYAVCGDLKFPRSNAFSDYDSTLTSLFNDRTLITVTQS